MEREERKGDKIDKSLVALLVCCDVKVTMSYVVPPIVMFLNKHPMVAKADLSSLNRLICGAAPLGREMVDEFRSKNPQCDIGQGLPTYFLCTFH